MHERDKTALAADEGNQQRPQSEADKAPRPVPANGRPLTDEQQREVERLQQRDREVREHEQVHARVGAPHTGSPSYEYQQGPDGKRYAVAGEVRVDLSEIPNDPKATLEKADKIVAAALAPKEPSAADHQVAARARRMAQEARIEMSREGLQDTVSQARGQRIAHHYLAAVTPNETQRPIVV